MKRTFIFTLCLGLIASMAVAADPTPPPPPPIVKTVRGNQNNQGNQGAQNQGQQQGGGRSGKKGGQNQGQQGGRWGRKGGNAFSPGNGNAAPSQPNSISLNQGNPNAGQPQFRKKGKGRGGNWSRGNANSGNANAGQANFGQNRGGKNNRGKGKRTNDGLAAAAAVLNAVANSGADVEVRGSRHGKGRWKGKRNISRRGPSEFAWSFGDARRRFHRGHRRDRSYYRDNYTRFALFAGGYYYFDRGYWYPAYGYDSAYSNYQFDEPIYGYGGLDPSQVITNVQNELRDQGYYDGEIDGLIGPQTRSALEEFQRDAELEVTRSIDGPTLAALGLT